MNFPSLSWWNRYFHGIPAATFAATAPLQEDLEELRARGRRGRLQAETSKLEGGKVEVMWHLKRLLIVSFLHCLLKDFRRATVKYITIYIYNWCILFIFVVGSWGTHLPKGVLFFSFWILRCPIQLGVGNQPRGLVEVAATLVIKAIHFWSNMKPWKRGSHSPKSGWWWLASSSSSFHTISFYQRSRSSRLSINWNWSKWSFETNVSWEICRLLLFQCLWNHSMGIAHILAYVILSHHISMINLW